MAIDWWTLALQTINVIVLVWLLARFFWKPVAGIIAEREAAAKKLLDDAEAARSEAEALHAGIEKTRAGFAKERAAILAEARVDAEKARSAILEEAHKQSDHLEAAARADLDRLAKKAEAAWARRASALAVDIAGRLVGRLDGATIEDAFLDWLVSDLEKLSEPVRKAAAESGAELTISTPSNLTTARRKKFQQKIGAALRTDNPLSFSVEPGLIGGVSVSGPNFVAESSWRADLRAILEELDDGEKA
ncbi:MAG: ATPase [Hyphomicrobiaceae bacterium]|nr:ATPase [Hyphomicrobiaceae bacterium]